MPKILLVDDSKSIRFYLGNLLREAGYQVLEAADGRDGLACLAHDPVDLVITDLSMPNQDGISMISELKETGAQVPVIGISGRASNYLALAEHLGASKVFTKPLDYEQLLAAVKELSQESKP
ncbi:MAG: response regulator [bacterium]|nr:response regulator [bacterium]